MPDTADVPSLAYPASAGMDAYARWTGTLQAVFLHTGWRSGGTWLWSRLRALDQVEGYYEPLHEQLAGLTPRRIQRMSAHSWQSGHGPTLPYYLEYAPLLDLPLIGTARGVRHYRPRFAVERFFLGPADEDSALQTYLAYLLSSAVYVERLPVLKFCRSLGRVAWMQARFPGAMHAVLLRDAAAQWHSTREQYRLAGNRYFLISPCLVLARNRDHPAVAEIVAHFGIRLPALPAGSRDLDRELCWRHLLPMGWPEKERLFLAYWLLTSTAALRGDALTIDLEELAQSGTHRAEVGQRFAEAGLALSLDGGRPPLREPPALAPETLTLAQSWLASGAGGLSSPSLGLLEKKLDLPGRIRAPSLPAVVRPAPAPGGIGRAFSGIYFLMIRLSMPLRHLNGYMRGRRADRLRSDRTRSRV